MLVHVYPDDEPMQLKALVNDQRRFAIALYQGKDRMCLFNKRRKR